MMPQHTTQRLAQVALVGAIFGGIALLASCGRQSETAEEAAAPSATVAAATAAAAVPIAYDCLPAQRLTASYDNSGTSPLATLTLDGLTYQLTGVPAADGAKYSTDQGRSAGKTLVWWTKGEEATLFEGTVGGTAEQHQQLAVCSPSTTG